MYFNQKQKKKNSYIFRWLWVSKLKCNYGEYSVKFLIKQIVQIAQKCLAKEHMQIDYDHVHNVIEHNLKNKEIYLPSEFIRLSKEARKYPTSYEATQLYYYDFFDYKLTKQRYNKR